MKIFALVFLAMGLGAISSWCAFYGLPTGWWYFASFCAYVYAALLALAGEGAVD